ncbi:hypothetical protein MAJ_04439, partial [Metarhizium majus ARSEF 297]
MGIPLDGRHANEQHGLMAISMIMVGAGGSFSVVGSRVASQAARPHQEVALAISLLTLRSKIGSAIGSAFVGGDLVLSDVEPAACAFACLCYGQGRQEDCQECQSCNGVICV